MFYEHVESTFMVNELEIWLANQCRRERIHQTTDKVENKTRDLRMTTTIDGKLKQLKRPVVRLEPMFYENVSREKNRAGNVGAIHQQARKLNLEHAG